MRRRGLTILGGKRFSAEELCGLELDKSDNLYDEERDGRLSSDAPGEHAIIHRFLAEPNLVNLDIARTVGQRQRTVIPIGDTRCKSALTIGCRY
jgi:hypothetical protein